MYNKYMRGGRSFYIIHNKYMRGVDGHLICNVITCILEGWTDSENLLPHEQKDGRKDDTQKYI